MAAEALRITDTEHEQVVEARQQQVDRLRYESQLAERQFMQSDPDNRLVTGELERRWEASLRETEVCRRATCSGATKRPNLHHSGRLAGIASRHRSEVARTVERTQLLKSSQKKALLRSLIDKVVIHRTAPRSSEDTRCLAWRRDN